VRCLNGKKIARDLHPWRNWLVGLPLGIDSDAAYEESHFTLHQARGSHLFPMESSRPRMLRASMFLNCQSNKSEHGDVIVLAEIDRSLGDSFRAGIADLEHTIETKQLLRDNLSLRFCPHRLDALPGVGWVQRCAWWSRVRISEWRKRNFLRSEWYLNSLETPETASVDFAF